MTLIHLEGIFDKQWPLRSETLPSHVGSQKPQFLSNLTRLNQIRKSVIRPVRNIPFKGASRAPAARAVTRSDPRAGLHQ